jgi:hypothetical protein
MWCAHAFVFAVFGMVSREGQGRGIPQPDAYAALLEKARRGELREDFPEAAPPQLRGFGGPADPALAQVFSGSFRETAKTSFASARMESIPSLEALFAPLPSDAQMTKDFPKLVAARNNEARVTLEKRNVKVPAWIYWVVTEGDHDYHIILGSTPQLTTTTVFMNAEVAGLPKTNGNAPPFPQQRQTIRELLATHQNFAGLFATPVAVNVTGSLLWDGEHRAPHNVGTAALRPKKAWEIHPVKKISLR